MRHPIRTIGLVAAAIILLTGCSTAHTFTLFLTVRNAEDGLPVSNVGVTIDTRGVEAQKSELTYGWPRDLFTGDDGRVTLDFMVSPYPSDKPHWYLKLKKEGYEPEVIDIKPTPQPRKPDGKTPLSVEVRLRPIAR